MLRYKICVADKSRAEMQAGVLAINCKIFFILVRYFESVCDHGLGKVCIVTFEGELLCVPAERFQLKIRLLCVSSFTNSLVFGAERRV